MLNSTLFTISMHILHTVLDTFPMVPLKRINLKIKLSLKGWQKCVIHG